MINYSCSFYEDIRANAPVLIIHIIQCSFFDFRANAPMIPLNRFVKKNVSVNTLVILQCFLVLGALALCSS
jgi:hypothetical protein